MADRMAGWTAYFSDVNPGTPEDARRWWSGRGDLVFETFTWRGTSSDQGALIEVRGLGSELGPPARRPVVRMAVSNEAIRRLVSVDLGVIGVDVGIIYSEDNGQTWARSPLSGSYRLSRQSLDDGVLTAELESWIGDLDRQRPRTWSHDEQQARYPGDMGFVYKRQIAQGLAEIKWPPTVSAKPGFFGE